MSSLKERVDRLILSHKVQPVRHNPPGKIVIDTSLAYSLSEVWTKVYSPEPGTGLTFPETVQRLSELGVTRYRVDFVTNTTIAYIGGSAHLYHFPSYATEATTPGAIPWSLEQLRAAIKKAREDAKNQKPDLPTYTRQIVEAGVCDYTCFVEGRKVTYTGYLGEQYSAWFMGAGSDAPINAGLMRRNTAPGVAYMNRLASYQVSSSPLRGNIQGAASEKPRLSNMNPSSVISNVTTGYDSKISIDSIIAAPNSDADPTPASGASTPLASDVAPILAPGTAPILAPGTAPILVPEAAPTPVPDVAPASVPYIAPTSVSDAAPAPVPDATLPLVSDAPLTLAPDPTPVPVPDAALTTNSNTIPKPTWDGVKPIAFNTRLQNSQPLSWSPNSPGTYFNQDVTPDSRSHLFSQLQNSGYRKCGVCQGSGWV